MTAKLAESAKLGVCNFAGICHDPPITTMLEIGVNFSYTPIIPSHNIPVRIENKIEKKVKEGKEEKEKSTKWKIKCREKIIA